MDLKKIQLEYYQKELQVETLSKEPYLEIQKWIKEIIDKEVSYPNAAILATSDASGDPSARVILIKDINEKGITFFTNYDSHKAKDINENNLVGLTFYWKEADRQIRVKARATKTTREESISYFKSRSIESQISAIASKQSQKVSKEDLIKKVQEIKDNKKIECPENWGGYLLEIISCEFWQGRPNRLHDRFFYEKVSGQWQISRLAP